jgi:hypothetical protein
MALTTTIRTTVTAAASKAIGTALSTSTNTLSMALTAAIASGTGNGKADLVFQDRRTLTASSSENLDLAGVLTGPLGDVLTFVKVRAIIVAAAAANTNDVVIGGAATNAFTGPLGATTHTIAVQAGGSIVLTAPTAGWAVTASTGDIIKVLNGGAGTPVTYDIVIVGASA